MRIAPALVASTVLLWVAPSPGLAAPIRITSGTLDITGLDPTYYRPSRVQLAGERGFTLDALTGSGSFAADLTCLFGCDPGTPVSLDATWGGLDLIGQATLDGVRYDVTGQDDDASAVVRFRADVRVPLSSADLVSVTAPFEFSGVFAYPSDGEGTPVDGLVGRGRVTATFEHPLQPDVGFYELKRTVFTFAPIPEPGTLILVGSGLLAGGRLALSRRRR